LNVLSVPPEIVGNNGPVISANVRDVLFRVAVTVRVKRDSSVYAFIPIPTPILGVAGLGIRNFDFWTG